MWKRIRTYLILGVIALLPTVATLYILKLIFAIIDPTLGVATAKLLQWLGVVQFPLVIWGIRFQTHIPGVGTLLTLGILVLIGMLARSLIGRQMLRFTEFFFSRIPLARNIYSTVQQITNTFTHDKATFKQVVMVEYPRKGVYTLGFYTGEGNGEIQRKNQKRMLNIFLPTTPNPTSGWLVLVPSTEVTFLNMSVEDGLKYIISGGVVVPPVREIDTVKGFRKEGISGEAGAVD
ncbi:putative membrane protein [Kroppenstedtia sanguinis]|uniref:DUF502 domain-containing protein n=1 Tax=Kroppenstedtia sanguinis TaxID=1380684 RepID=A0ABW4C6Y3_9BACL